MDSLLKKLNYKEQDLVVVINAPEEFRQILGDWASQIRIAEEMSEIEEVAFLLAFIEDSATLDRVVSSLKDKLHKDTVLWFAYPKRSSKRYDSDLSRDNGWELVGSLGYEPVRQVAIDQDWSALRFRPFKEIQRFTRSRALSQEGQGAIDSREES